MCQLFELGIWWNLLGVLDHMTGLDCSGTFYEAHQRVCPEVRS